MLERLLCVDSESCIICENRTTDTRKKPFHRKKLVVVLIAVFCEEQVHLCLPIVPKPNVIEISFVLQNRSKHTVHASSMIFLDRSTDIRENPPFKKQIQIHQLLKIFVLFLQARSFFTACLSRPRPSLRRPSPSESAEIILRVGRDRLRVG